MLEFGWVLDVGKKRQGKQNQDALKICKPWGRLPLLVVADGMGGFNGGREASAVVVRTLVRSYRRKKARQAYTDYFNTAVLAAHGAIMRRAKRSEKLAKMGSTVAAVVVDEAAGKLTLTNVGDTRIYLITPDAIQQISLDHSEVAELVRHGVLNEQEAHDYKRKNILTMSLMASRPQDTIKPHTEVVDFPPEGVVLLCSDGLWGCVSAQVLMLTALEYAPQEAAQKLAEFANTAGGPDNISVLIARRKGDWEKYRQWLATQKEITR